MELSDVLQHLHRSVHPSLASSSSSYVFFVIVIVVVFFVFFVVVCQTAPLPLPAPRPWVKSRHNVRAIAVVLAESPSWTRQLTAGGGRSALAGHAAPLAMTGRGDALS